jgi:hypothetical protein
MASTYTANTGIEKPGDGEQVGAWGDTTNLNFDIFDRLIAGVGAITLSGTTHSLTTTDGALSEGHYKVLVFGGSPSGTNTVTISPNDQTKLLFVRNISGESIIITQGSGSSVTVATAAAAVIYADGGGSGANVVDLSALFPAAAGTVTETGTQTLTNKTLDDATFTGSFTEQVHTLSGTSVALDPANGTIQTHTLTGNTTYTENLANGQSLTLMVDDGSGFTITWPTMTWFTTGGADPILNSTGYSVFVLWQVAGTVYGAVVKDAND